MSFQEADGVSFGNEIAAPDSEDNTELPTRGQFVDSATVVVERLPDGKMRFNVVSGTVERYTATATGQILMSLDGTTFTPVLPITNEDGFILTTDDGFILVTQ